MPTYRLELEQPLRESQVDELSRRVYFISDAIIDFKLIGGDSPDTAGIVSAVEVTTDHPVEAAELTRKLRSVVDREVRSQLPTVPKVLWRSAAADRPTPPGAFARLVERDVAHEVEPGAVALGQPALAALEALDALLRTIAVTGLGAREYRYPTLLPLRALQRGGYLAAFPQHLMVAPRLLGDVDTYRDVSAAAGQGRDLATDVLGWCAPVTRCLPPTMCYHTFNQFADRRLDGPRAGVVTARGRAFRHESRYQTTMERLADFTIRETVFIGSADFVRDAVREFECRVLALVDDLDLAGRCEVASDLFFASEDAGGLGSGQRLLERKRELRLDVGPEFRGIAVGSFNLHDTHFGEAFGIQDSDGEVARSACVGFGLERLTYAVFCQHGGDVDRWPPLLRESCALPTGQVR